MGFRGLGMKAVIRSFRPIADASSRVLVLGSMPGRASLAAGQYYAHPRNLFWRIMGRLFDLDPDAAYPRRVAALRAQGVALWDVLASCTRATSLDADIDPASMVVNDFGRFLVRHPRIATICFNGARAQAVYRRHVHPALPDADRFVHHRLPSTSPAHAARSFDEKLAAWQVVRRALQ